MSLFRQHFRSHVTGLLIWLVIAVLLIAGITSTAQAATGTDAMQALINKLPEALRGLAGMPEGLSPIDGYIGMKVGPIVMPMLTFYAVLLALSVVTREIDRRTIDFLLSLPVGRRQVMLARVGVLAVNTAALALVSWLVTWADLTRQNIAGSFAAYGLMLLGQWLVALAVGGVTLLASLWIDDYSLGVKAGLGFVGGAYFLEMVMKAASVDRTVRAWNPFSYMDGIAILESGALPWADAVVLAIVVIVTLALSLRRFEQKQINA